METKEPLQLWELSRLVESLALTLKPKPDECPVMRRLPKTLKSCFFFHFDQCLLVAISFISLLIVLNENLGGD